MGKLQQRFQAGKHALTCIKAASGLFLPCTFLPSCLCWLPVVLHSVANTFMDCRNDAFVTLSCCKHSVDETAVSLSCHSLHSRVVAMSGLLCADGQQLMVGGAGLAMWDASTQQRLYKYPGHTVRPLSHVTACLQGISALHLCPASVPPGSCSLPLAPLTHLLLQQIHLYSIKRVLAASCCCIKPVCCNLGGTFPRTAKG